MSVFVENIEKNYRYNREYSLLEPLCLGSDFSYSDGDEVEQRLFEIIQSAQDVSCCSDELKLKVTDWPSHYHLGARRANLLRPLQALLKGKILEIGAGCGAITRYLGETDARVFAVEGSPRRASIAAARCRGLDNVTIINDAFHNIPAAPEFDVVTLIGVLEYARIYFPSESGVDPVDAMLERARQMLCPGGVLIVAIENQLGLKYFAGFPEDHVGRPMFGVEDLYRPDGVVTFGRQELRRRIDAVGLPTQEWLYPFPDYKLPVSVLSERLFAAEQDIDVGAILANCAAADPQRPAYVSFSLEQVWQSVARNRLVEDLANSFLVIASAERISQSEEIELLWHYSADRIKKYAREMRFVEHDRDVMIRQKKMFPDEVSEIDAQFKLHLKDEPYRCGELWQQKFHRIVTTPGWSVDDLADWVKVWIDAVASSVCLSGDSKHLAADTLVPSILLDAIPRNMIVDDCGGCYFIDQEWESRSEITFGYLFYRGVFNQLSSESYFAQPAQGTPLIVSELFLELARRFNIYLNEVNISIFIDLENMLCTEVFGRKYHDEKNMSKIMKVVDKNDVLYAKNIHLCLENTKISLELASIKQSCSWKITKPLRKLASKFRIK